MIKLAVLGNPVAHSRSPEIHLAFARQASIEISYEKVLAFARQASIEISYEKVLAPLDGFAKTARQFIAAGARGFNVTVPFKQEAYALVDELGSEAVLSGAVNTVSVDERGRLTGENTDGAGIVADLEQNLGWTLRGSRILVLGAGGAVRGILPAILKAKPDAVALLNRTHQRALELAEIFGEAGPVRAITETMIETPYDIVISGSSAGLSSNEITIPPGAVGPDTCCYDMIYSSGTTPFNAAAINAGCQDARDGLGMLVEQAARAFHIWCDFEPDTAIVIDELRKTLE